MALTVKDYIKPRRTLSGIDTPTMTVQKESATTWSKGAVIVVASGYAVVAADDAASGTIIGVAVENATDGKTEALICPALPGVVFSAHLVADAAGADHTSLVTNRYVPYGIALVSAPTYALAVDETTADAAMVIDFIDAVGTVNALCEIVFTDTVFTTIE